MAEEATTQEKFSDPSLPEKTDVPIQDRINERWNSALDRIRNLRDSLDDNNKEANNRLDIIEQKIVDVGLYYLDVARFTPFLGKEKAQKLARFNKITRKHNLDFQPNRWMREEFFNFIDSHEDEELSELVRASDGRVNEYFTYGFLDQRKALEQLVIDKKLRQFAAEIGDYGIFGDVFAMDKTPEAGFDFYEIVKDVYQKTLDLGALTQHQIVRKIVDNNSSIFVHELGSILRLNKYPEAFNYVTDDKLEIKSHDISFIEFMSMEPVGVRLLEEIREKIHNGDESAFYATPKLFKKFIDSSSGFSNPVIKRIFEKSIPQLNKLYTEWYQASPLGNTIKRQRLFDGMSYLALKVDNMDISEETKLALIDAIPFSDLSFNNITFINNNNLLDKLENSEAFQSIVVEVVRNHNDISILGLILAAEKFDSKENPDQILDIVNTRLNKLSDDAKKLFLDTSPQILDYLSKNPLQIEDLINLLEDKDVLIALKPGGVLADSNETFFNAVFLGTNPQVEALNIVRQFTNPNLPFWEKVYFFAVNNNQRELENLSIEYWINFDESGVDRHVKFNTLTSDEKKSVLRSKIREAIESSGSKEEKKSADLRNRNLTSTSQLLTPNVRLHATKTENLSRILRSGLLCGECIVKQNNKDAYPFFNDYAIVEEQSIKNNNGSFRRILEEKTNTYSNYFNQGLVLIFRPDNDIVKGGSGSDHALKFAAESATALSGVIIDTELVDEKEIDEVRFGIAENGFYVPVYDKAEKLLFTPEEYDELRAHYNLDLELEIWDASLQQTKALGSNPGGVYLVPEAGGLQRYYVKFMERDRVWSEWLACKFYEAYGVAVPDTMVRIVDGRVAFTSKWVDGENKNYAGEDEPLENGFIIDAWMANWDIAWAQSQNLLDLTVGKLRIDNGGALFYTATGRKKDTHSGSESFTNNVVEVEDSIDGIKGTGMRNQYRNLTYEKEREQALRLKKTITPELIITLIGQTQLSPNDKKLLIDTLLKRREYILKKYKV